MSQGRASARDVTARICWPQNVLTSLPNETRRQKHRLKNVLSQHVNLSNADLDAIIIMYMYNKCICMVCSEHTMHIRVSVPTTLCRYFYAYVECGEDVANRHVDEDLKDYQYQVLSHFYEPHFEECGCKVGESLPRSFKCCPNSYNIW